MKTYTRRDNLVMGLGLALTACGGTSTEIGEPILLAPTPTPSPTASPTPSPSPSPTSTPTPTTGIVPLGIAAAAAAKNMTFGSCFAASGVANNSYTDPGYAALLEGNCNTLVPENELKWYSVQPSKGVFDFTKSDAMLAYAQSKGMTMRGHTLLWYREDGQPNWLRGNTYDFGANAPAEARRLVVAHIQEVTRRYKGKITSWDVVNEAVNPDSEANPGQIRTNSLARAMGNVGTNTELLDLAFTTARAELGAGAELVYNDYMDGGTPKHREGVLALLKGFKDRGVPVDTLGIQSHIGFYGLQGTDPIGNAINYNTSQMKPFLDAVVALGYKLKITEMDVNDVNVPGTNADRDAATARFARAWLDMMFSYGASMKDVLFWGMTDKYSWLQGQGFGTRADGQPKRPDPYDLNLAAKPMRQSIIEAFNATTVRA